MVNDAVTSGHDAERALAISYATPDARPALTALLALDRRLGQLAVVGREPMLAQMRLTWWHDALIRLDASPAPAEPLLVAVAADILSRGVTGAGLAAMVDGWQLVLAPPLDGAALDSVADRRGATLFAIAATLLGASDPAVVPLGQGWALADLSRRLTGEGARLAATMARQRLDSVSFRRWPRPLRPLGALALLARADLAGVAPGSPRRVGRLALHRLTGR